MKRRPVKRLTVVRGYAARDIGNINLSNAAKTVVTVSMIRCHQLSDVCGIYSTKLEGANCPSTFWSVEWSNQSRLPFSS